jgi:hypothetical protein
MDTLASRASVALGRRIAAALRALRNPGAARSFVRARSDSFGEANDSSHDSG